MLLVSQGLQAQVSKTISKEQFNASIDTLNYDYLLFLLKDDRKPYAADFEEFRNKKVSIEQLQFFFTGKKADPVYLQIANEINGLKAKYKNDDDFLRSLLTEDIYNDSSLTNFHNYHKKRKGNDDYLNFVNEISSKLLKQLPISDNKVIRQEENHSDTGVSDITQAKEKQEENKKKPEWFRYLLFGFIGYLTGSFMTFIFRRKQEKMQSKQTDQQFQDLLKHKEQEIKKLKEKIVFFEKQFSSDRKTDERISMNSQKQPESYGSLESDRALDKHPVSHVSSESDKLLVRQPDYAPLYFPNPTSEGFFPTNNGRGSFVEGASIFKFNVASSNEATYEYCDDSSSIKIALNNRNELILSVAEELTAYNPAANKIVTEVPGKVLLEGEVWKVTQKAKVKYI